MTESETYNFLDTPTGKDMTRAVFNRMNTKSTYSYDRAAAIVRKALEGDQICQDVVTLLYGSYDWPKV